MKNKIQNQNQIGIININLQNLRKDKKMCTDIEMDAITISEKFNKLSDKHHKNIVNKHNINRKSLVR